MRLNPVLGFGRGARQCARRFHVAAVLFVIAALLSPGFSLYADDAPLPEYRVKSLFLYNFAKFIQWPSSKFDSPKAPLVIGIYGKNPFNDFLKDLEGKSSGSHKIVVRPISSPTEARRCHIVFIGDSAKRITKLVSQLKGDNILTVTDEMEIEGFQSAGAVINLVTRANRTVHFEINVDAARRAELKINSSLLNLAKIVRDGRA
jgi:hypothetical protein